MALQPHEGRLTPWAIGRVVVITVRTIEEPDKVIATHVGTLSWYAIGAEYTYWRFKGGPKTDVFTPDYTLVVVLR